MKDIPEKDPGAQWDSEAVTFVRLALALANDYESVYVIDTQDDSYVEYKTAGADKELSRASSGEDFYEDTRHNCRAMVYHEDQEMFLTAFRKETVLSALKDGKSFSLRYRLVIGGRPLYYFLKTIRGTGEDGRYIIVGVQNVDEQVRRELAAEDKRKTYAEIAGSLASLFVAIYHIDINTGKYTEYSSDGDIDRLGLGADREDFFTAAENYIDGLVHQEDRESIRTLLDREALMEQLEKSESLSMTFRQFLDGRMQYVDLLAFKQKGRTDRLVICIRNVDEQKRRENAAAAESGTYSRIARALASKYEVIYHVDIVTNEYVQYSASENYAKLGTTKEGSDFFQAAAEDIVKYIYPEDRDRLMSVMEKDRLLQALKQTGSLSLTYRQMLDGRPQYVTLLAVMPKNDPSRVIMGVMNVDAQTRRELSMARESETFGEIVRALALRYEVIYYVNTVTHEYREYSASEKYSKLGVGIMGRDFFGDTQKNMKRDIYPEDYPMMATAMEKEQLMSSIEETGSYTLNYRLMLDNEPQYVTLFAVKPKEDSEHVIIAVANVDAAKRREMAYKEALGSAMDMASRDALTGVKNKHAYVQAEMELDRQVAEGCNPDFAVAVADVNGLKIVNDSKGHHAGDEYIKAACRLICTTFKHSPVFRIGGDEFAVILKGQDLENSEKLMSDITGIMEHNKGAGLVTAAIGISRFISGRDIRVQDVFERADKAMYDDKQLHKK